MNTVIKPKRSEVPGSVPTIDDLQDGELAVNTADKIFFMRCGNEIWQAKMTKVTDDPLEQLFPEHDMNLQMKI